MKLMVPFAPKAKLMFSGRRNWRADLKKKFQDNNNSVVWFHSASLGEFEQTRPLIEKFSESWPSYQILISFFSPSGYEIRKSFQPSYHIAYLPFDNRRNAKFWLDIVKPSIIFFTKYEFWYHYTDEIKKRSIPLISFSSIFRKSQIYFSWYGKFNQHILKNFTYFFVQNEESIKLLNSIGINNVEQTGDTRFDRVIEISRKSANVETIEQFKGNQRLIVCGSVWESDMVVISELINNLSGNYKFVVAPHEIEEKNIDQITSRLSEQFAKYTTYDKDDSSRVMILDTVGNLSSIYGYADAAYIGGAFGKGLHNILEASVFRIPVFFGNDNYKKFNEAVELVNLGAAFPVSSGAEMISKFENIEDSKESLKEIISKYFDQKKGATERILEYCREIIK